MISRFEFFVELAKERPEFRALCCYWEFDKVTPEMTRKAENLYRKRVKRDYKKITLNVVMRKSYFRTLREIRAERAIQTAANDRAAKQRRRAAKINAKPSWFGEFDELAMREAAALCIIRERDTGISWHIDHMIPLLSKTACGLHCADNIQVIPAKMNGEKNNKMELCQPGDWLK